MIQLDEKLKQMYQQEAEKYMPPETMKMEIEKRVESGYVNSHALRGMRRRFILLLAGLLLLLGSLTSVASIKVASLRGYANATPDYTDYRLVDGVAAGRGYPIKSVETFSNDYTFYGLTVNHYAYYDAQDRKISGEMSSLHLEYRNGAASVDLSVDQPWQEPIRPKKIVEEYEVEGVTIFVTQYIHLMVPPDYELSEEERQLKADGILGTGTDSTIIEPSRSYILSLQWEQNGMSFLLSESQGETSVDEMKVIAAEWICANAR